MSETLISTTEVTNLFYIIFQITIIILWLVILAYLFIKTNFENKQDKFKEEKEKCENEYKERVKQLPDCLDSEVEGQAEQKKKLADELEENKKVLDEKIEKYTKKSKNLYNIVYSGGLVLVMIIVFAFIVGLISSFDVGGNFSDIKRVTEVENSGTSVTAYYEVKYKKVEQRTLTVFVKNNSTQTVDDAVIKEVNSNSQAVVYSIEPGQEKIVTLEVYPNFEDDYKFEISEVNYK
jgi:ABC-type transport system involved in cytochrome bd biosynthesis fused ATPase/permease subunit